jgi:hypothetical protein
VVDDRLLVLVEHRGRRGRALGDQAVRRHGLTPSCGTDTGRVVGDMRRLYVGRERR